MNNEKKRLSLDAFKAKASVDQTQKSLSKVTGGILGNCHPLSDSGAL